MRSRVWIAGSLIVVAIAGMAASVQRTPVYVDSSAGIVPVETQAGTHEDSIVWLQNFRGRLLPELPADPADTRTALREALWAEFLTKENLLMASWGSMSQRQRLVVFLVLRVNGSLPTYTIREYLPVELERLILSHRGNCSDHAARLAMVLDAFDIQSAFVPLNTPSLPGHVLVDAYDPQSQTAYLLDSLGNVVLLAPGVSTSFLTWWMALTPAQRTEYFDDPGPGTRWMPTYYRFVDGGVRGLTSTPITVQELNETDSVERAALFQSALTAEWEQVLAWWRDSYPYQPPRTLAELGSAFDITGLQKFGPLHGVSTEPLWSAAGLSVYDPGVTRPYGPFPFDD